MNDELGVVERDGDRWSVRFVRRIDASALDVWDTLTNPERIARWMQTESMIMEPRAGGAVHYRWGGSDECHGTVSIFDPPHTLEYSWNEGENESIVRFDIIPLEEGVKLTLEHRMLRVGDLKGIGPGWHTHLDYLDAVLHDEPFEFEPRFHSLEPIYAQVLQQI